MQHLSFDLTAACIARCTNHNDEDTSLTSATNLNNVATELIATESFRHLFSMQKLKGKSCTAGKPHRKCTDSYTSIKHWDANIHLMMRQSFISYSNKPG